jgi:hypothetical protein
MSKKHWWNDYERQKPKHSEKDLSQRHFVHRPVPAPLCTQTCPSATLYTDLSQRHFVHRPVPAPLYTQTCPSATLYTDLSQRHFLYRPVPAPLCTQTCPCATLYTDMYRATLYSDLSQRHFVLRPVPAPLSLQILQPATPSNVTSYRLSDDLGFRSSGVWRGVIRLLVTRVLKALESCEISGATNPKTKRRKFTRF